MYSYSYAIRDSVEGLLNIQTAVYSSKILANKLEQGKRKSEFASRLGKSQNSVVVSTRRIDCQESLLKSQWKSGEIGDIRRENIACGMREVGDIFQ